MPQGNYISTQRKKRSFLLAIIMLIFGCSGLSAAATGLGAYVFWKINEQSSQKPEVSSETYNNSGKREEEKRSQTADEENKNISGNENEDKGESNDTPIQNSIQHNNTLEEMKDGGKDNVPTQCQSDCNSQEIAYCISKVEVVYSIGIKINCSQNVKIVFEKYVEYLVQGSDGEYKDTSFSFTEARCEGLYNGLRYWVVAYHYKTSWGDEGNGEIYVNENGEVVEFYGCE